MSQIIIGAVIFLYAAAAVGGLMALSTGWPCANPRCKNRLAHADYTSEYCQDCRHLDTALVADPSLRHKRTAEALHAGRLWE